ncbi:MAG: AzlD domain-containing protein [Archaeoglobus sp.]|nr:AzlD domain-containing protein [Archaeoglobus sp.]
MEILLVILGMSIVTFIPRVLPFFTEIDIERYSFLKFIPVAVFSSLALPDVFAEFQPEKIIAALAAVGIAYKTRRMFLTVFVAVALLYFLRKLF